MEHQLTIVPIHKHRHLMPECCALINDEWKRSETARMMSLLASCDELPTNLILINERCAVLGHAKLTAIPCMPNSCFIESVVIKRELRGQKLGSFLMTEVENYAKKNLKLKMLHLSTKGQEEFYRKLGYVECEPISIYGSPLKQISDYKPCQKSDSNPRAPKPPLLPSSKNNLCNQQKKTFMVKDLL